MKKYTILMAISVLLVSSMACKALNNLSSGGSAPADGGGVENPPQSQPPVTTDGGNVSVGGEAPFPVVSDAFNVVSTPETVTYQTKMTSDDVIQFYRDEFGKLGYTEDTSMASTFAGAFTLAFTGHESGRMIIIGGASDGSGNTVVSIALQ